MESWRGWGPKAPNPSKKNLPSPGLHSFGAPSLNAGGGVGGGGRIKPTYIADWSASPVLGLLNHFDAPSGRRASGST